MHRARQGVRRGKADTERQDLSYSDTEAPDTARQNNRHDDIGVRPDDK